MAESSRYEELDSLRGLAALTVVSHHYFLANPSLSDQATGLMNALIHSPLHVFWAGPEAVSLFYVLSGFVLALPFLNRPKPYAFFAVQRTARIYGPYIFAVGAGYLARQLFNGSAMPGLSDWVNSVWIAPNSTSAKNIVGHVLLLPNFESGRIVPVFWSLVQEMRASLIFPLLVLICFKVRFRWVVVLSVCLFTIGSISTYMVMKRTTIDQDYTVFLEVVPLFLFGVLLAMNRQKAVAWIENLAYWQRLALFAASVLAYTYRWWVPIPRLSLMFLLITGVAGVAFILLAMGSPHAKKLLHWSPIHAVGTASYSLYLVHGFVLIACLHALYGRLGYIGACGVAAVLTVPITWLFWRFIEIPATELSHRLGRVPEPPIPAQATLIRVVPIACWIAASVVCGALLR